MTLLPNVYQGLLMALRTSTLTKWGSGLAGNLTGSVSVTGSVTMNYLIGGALAGAGAVSDEANALSSVQGGALAGAGAVTGEFESTYSLATLTPAQVATILGSAEPTLMWRYDEASGATELVSGTLNLADAGSPSKQVSSTALGADTTEFTAGSSTERMANATAADVGTGTISVIHIHERITAGNIRALVGKRSSAAGNYGWEFYLRTTGHTVDYDGVTTAVSLTNTTDHGTGNAEVTLTKQSPTDNECGVWTRLASTTSVAATGSLTNTREFSVGDGFRSADGSRSGMTLVWLGSGGDGFGETERSALAVALGYEV